MKKKFKFYYFILLIYIIYINYFYPINYIKKLLIEFNTIVYLRILNE